MSAGFESRKNASGDGLDESCPGESAGKRRQANTKADNGNCPLLIFEITQAEIPVDRNCRIIPPQIFNWISELRILNVLLARLNEIIRTNLPEGESRPCIAGPNLTLGRT